MPLPSTFAAPFVVNPQLTAITLRYKNARLIADDILPRVAVDTPSFIYSVFNQGDSFTIPDTKVGRKSAVNQVDWNATQTPAFVEDYALDEVVPNRDKAIAQAYGNYIDPEEVATEQVSDLLALGREKRVADLVFNANSYATANKSTLSGTAQWSDHTNSDPLAAMLTALDGMVMRATTLVMGRTVATQVLTHPKILQAYHGNAGAFGLAPASFLAELLGLESVLIGESWDNSAKKGQTVTRNLLWGKFAALLYKAPVSSSQNSPSFGFTAQWGDRLTASYQDPKIGMRGSTVVRVGEAVKELVMANDLGYLFSAAVA